MAEVMRLVHSWCSGVKLSINSLVWQDVLKIFKAELVYSVIGTEINIFKSSTTVSDAYRKARTLCRVAGKRKNFKTILQGYRSIYFLINEEKRFSKRSEGYTILILFIDRRIDTSTQWYFIYQSFYFDHNILQNLQCFSKCQKSCIWVV